MSGTIAVTGAVADPAAISPATLASNYAPVTVTTGSGLNAQTYTGASVYSIISGAQFLYSTSVKNGFLLDYVEVTGASGAPVLLSEGELDPSFGGASSTDIIAYSRDGVPIEPQLIVPGDADGGVGGRDVAGITSLAVGTAGAAAALPGEPAAPPLTVSGDVSSAANPYTASSLETIGQTTQTDTFLAGTTPNTLTFTGAPIASVLSDAGLSAANQLNDYVVATGSDGYGVLYSDAELDPAVRTSPTALIAYNDGTGTFPSVGGAADALRTTAPTDAKGGRYVSNLDSIAAATPSNDAVYRLYEGAVGRAPDAAGNAFWSGLLESGVMVTAVAQGLLQSAESQNFLQTDTGNTAFVASLYQDVLGRMEDAAGAGFWTGLLNSGTSKAAVLAGFASSAEAIEHNATGTAFALAVGS